MRLDRLGEGVEELRRAVELAPQQPRYVYVHAVAVANRGQHRCRDRSARCRPGAISGRSGASLRAAAFSRDNGEIARAIGYARRLLELEPNDPQVAAFLRELESRRR